MESILTTVIGIANSGLASALGSTLLGVVAALVTYRVQSAEPIAAAIT